jgi:SAM-dependent MidA family methyltransferase
VTALAARIAARVRRDGPLPFSTFVDLALYEEPGGFYASGGEPGRRGDFLTSAEVGPLFGAVLARALDQWWIELGRPDPFTFVDCGAGPGTLARALLGADADCRDALQLVLVERSARLRARHPVDARVESRHDLPAGPITGVVFANELLDNLGFDLLERHEGEWREVRVDVRNGAIAERLVPAAPSRLAGVPDDAPDGARVPVQGQAQAWLGAALAVVPRGRVVVVDYADTTASMAARPWRDWVRTYRGHERGGHPLADPGAQDVTVEVAVDQLAAVRPPAVHRRQAEFLRAHGIDALVADGRRIWQERAHLGDLTAIRARSRVREAEALVDPAGLGGFAVIEWLTP